jgi:hypothetical protein
MVDRKLVLLNDMALQLKPEALAPGDTERVYIAGNNLVRMTLGELALPGAEMIWTDFRHSASLAGLHRTVQQAGGLDRMILAADGEHGESVFSVMCAVLTLLPSLRRRPSSHVELICLEGKAAPSLVEFVDRIQPQLATSGVSVSLELLQHADRAAA